MLPPPRVTTYTMSDLVKNDINLMNKILEFNGENCYLYTGFLSKYHKKYLGVKVKTSRHFVGQSRRRISREIWKDEGVKFITECVISSARKGDLLSIKRIDAYCKRNNIRLLTCRHRNPMVSAAASGNLPTMMWMHHFGFAMGTSVILAASKAPNAPVNIQWLIDRGCSFDVESEIELAKRGDIPSLKILRSRKGLKGFSTRVLMSAISGGESSTVKYLVDDDCQLTSEVLCLAASTGNMEIVRTLCNYGCPFDEKVCYFAAIGGHINVIRELRSHGCPWDFFTIRVAVHNEDVELLKFCIQEECPGYLFLTHY